MPGGGRQPQRGVQHVFRDGGQQRRRGGVGVFAAEQVHGAAAADQLGQLGGGPAAPGTHRARMSGWKNRPIACCTVVTVLPTVSADHATPRPAARPRTSRRAGAAQDLGRLLGRDRVGHPLQDVLQAAAGQRRGVEERLQHLGGLGGVEPGRGVCRPPLTAPVTVPAAKAFARRSATLGSTQPATGSHTSSGTPGAAPNGSSTATGRAPRRLNRLAADPRPWSG